MNRNTKKKVLKESKSAKMNRAKKPLAKKDLTTKDQAGQYVADAVLGIDTLWGGDVMCASGTGRFIADSWISDEVLPPAYKVAAAARVRETGGVTGKNLDRRAVEEYLKQIDVPGAIRGIRGEG